jgi:hypothetical protein
VWLAVLAGLALLAGAGFELAHRRQRRSAVDVTEPAPDLVRS